MNIDQNVELLNNIYQNTRMGAEAISALFGNINNHALRADLQTQLNEYNAIST